MKKVSIVDFVHALFKSSVIDICEKDGGYLFSTRLRSSQAYNDGRKIIYTFSAENDASFADILKRLGIVSDSNRPYFCEGDKELIAEAIVKEIKSKCPNWADFLDDRIQFRRGGKGYS